MKGIWYRWNRETDEVSEIAVDQIGNEDEDFERARRVGLDYVETSFGTIRVSTVFLGLNHNWGDGPPVLFETMMFGGPRRSA